jgi:uncharacterized repeat protein (TIGR03843 family)
MDTNTDILEILQLGKITLEGEFVWGSNYTFLVNVESNGQVIKAVYKPTRGERPLWDFPAASLAKREAAAYWVSQALKWELVPPTVYRKKAPIGAGSLQLYIEHDPNYHYFNFTEEDRQRLRPTVVFDFLINNADRKGSHILVDKDRHFWLIDHGVCFHVEDKLRTVIWDFVGEPIPDELLDNLQHMLSTLESAVGEEPTQFATMLSPYLTRGEIRALARRAQNLIASSSFPNIPADRRPYPWPAV